MRKLVVLLGGGLGGVSWRAWNRMTELKRRRRADIGFGMTSTAYLYQGLNIFNNTVLRIKIYEKHLYFIDLVVFGRCEWWSIDRWDLDRVMCTLQLKVKVIMFNASLTHNPIFYFLLSNLVCVGFDCVIIKGFPNRPVVFRKRVVRWNPIL